LGFTDLQGAKLWYAYLKGALLIGANLQEVQFRLANLQGADLERANLHLARFAESTILPDGTNWTPDTDMARFTDPGHPDFWPADHSDFEIWD
jgi:uncharacterized protein YjbI with pentapeptide repeats